MLHGVPHGNGVWKYRNGTKFEGNFKNGIRWGHGKLFGSNNSIIHEGNYVDNKLERNKLRNSEYDDLEGEYGDYEEEYRYERSDWGLQDDGEWSVSDYNIELWHRGGYIKDDAWAE